MDAQKLLTEEAGEGVALDGIVEGFSLCFPSECVCVRA